jgi:Transcription factor WhiB
VTALATEGTQRARILSHLAIVPDLTGHQLARVVGAAGDLSDVLRAMEGRAEVVSRTEWQPQQGRRVRLWRLAPWGTIPPPRAPEPADVAERRRERDRLSQRARRARNRPAVPQLAADLLPGAACASADPGLFFPEPGDEATEAAARAICAACPARPGCYAGAVARGERWGIWGGENLETVHRRPGGRPQMPAMKVTIAP